VEEMDVSKLVVSPLNVRKHIEGVADLADNISQVGVIEPLVVRPSKEGYEIVVGQRRFLAAQQAGLKKIPVIVRELSDYEAIRLSLVENLHSEQLSPIDRAEAVAALVSFYEKEGYPRLRAIKKAAEDASITETRAQEFLRVLATVASVKEAVAKREVEVPVAARLKKFEPEEQEELVEAVKELPVHVARRVINHYAAKKVEEPEYTPMDAREKVISEEIYTVSVRIPGDLYRAIDRLSEKHHRSMHDEILRALRAWVSQNE